MKQIFHQLFIAEWGTVNVGLCSIFGDTPFMHTAHGWKQERVETVTVHDIEILITQKQCSISFCGRIIAVNLNCQIRLPVCRKSGFQGIKFIRKKCFFSTECNIKFSDT